jgi:hypothetical protein
MSVPYGGSYAVGLFDNTGQLPTFTMVWVCGVSASKI